VNNDKSNGYFDEYCKQCQGTGIVRVRYGDRTVQERCKHCDGTGKRRSDKRERVDDPSHPVAEGRA